MAEQSRERGQGKAGGEKQGVIGGFRKRGNRKTGEEVGDEVACLMCGTASPDCLPRLALSLHLHLSRSLASLHILVVFESRGNW